MIRKANCYKAAEIAQMLKCSVRKVQMLWDQGKLLCNVENGGHHGRYSTLEMINSYTRQTYGKPI